jgi:hypothetical protein
MSSVLRYTKEPTPTAKRFTVFPYYGYVNPSKAYYFTVEGNTLYRVENDLINNSENDPLQWVVARDMGTEAAITTIDPEIIEIWESSNDWTDISVIRPGRARKFQALAIPKGNIDASYNNGPAWNAGAYTDPNNIMTGNIYNPDFTGINDLLIMGNSSTIPNGDYYESLPYATFFAVIDPVVIQYENNGSTYRRAVVNRVVPS